jgi:hypothetical protein
MPTLASAAQPRVPVAQRIDFSYAGDFAGRSGAAVDALKLPPGAMVQHVVVVTTTAFNSLTSDVMSAGDAGDGTFYLNGADVHAAGTDRSGTGKDYPTGGVITLTWTGVATVPTQGAGSLFVEYYIHPDFL